MGIGPFTQTGPARKVARFADNLPLYATQYLRSDGGRFMTLDTGTGTWKLTIANDTKIGAWADACYSADRTTNPMNATPFVSSSTSGVSNVSGTYDVHSGPDCAFWIPAATGTTASRAYIGQKCDIVIEGSTTTTKQLANLGTDSVHALNIVDVDIPNNLVLVYANI